MVSGDVIKLVAEGLASEIMGLRQDLLDGRRPF